MGKKEKTGTIFEGIITGKVTSWLGGIGAFGFSVKIDDEIEGIPNEIGVRIPITPKMSLVNLVIRPDDIVIIKGKILKIPLKSFPDNYSIIMVAENVYNDTLKCGY